MNRPRGFIDWKPQKKTMLLVNAILEVIEEYRAQLPLTLRQIFYRLVVKNALDKTEKGYSRLCEVANKARRAEMIDMEDIRDDGFNRNEPATMTSARDVVSIWNNDLSVRQFDRQAGQDRRIAVWCEANGMVPMLYRITQKYGVPVFSSGGFDSLTSKHEMASRMVGRNYEVLHIGDYDPSGVHVFFSLSEDVNAFAGHDVGFTRIAVTPDQIDQWHLPTAPPKQTDRRRFDDSRTVQAEAIAPDVLVQFLEDEITSRIDLDVYSEILGKEDVLRQEVQNLLDKVS